MTEKDSRFDVEETVFYFAFVCKGTLQAFEKIKQAILKTEGCELRFQTKSPVRLWISKQGVNENEQKGQN
jgi:hypothetical protein